MITIRRKIIGWLLLIVLAPLAGWFWYVRLHSPAFMIVWVGGRLTSDNLDISSRTVVVVPPKPGVVFSTVRKPGGDEEFTYLILFRYGSRISSYSTFIINEDDHPVQHCMIDHFGRWAETHADFEVNGSPIEACYRVILNETRTAVTNESLTIGGKGVDIVAGQVFLIDLKAESPVYKQTKVELPAIPSKLETTEDAERAAEAILKSLESKNPEIKAFLH